MKAALFERPGVLNVVARPLRRLVPDEVLVTVDACGICGTDVHIVEGTSRSSPPVVLGHEYTGTIADVGGDVQGWTPGDRVGIDPNISCGTCYYCRRGLVHLCTNLRALGVDIDGGLAESNIAPARQLYRIPKGMTPEQSAFVEPVSCAVHGIDLARIKAGDTVVVIGGGTIGLIMLQLARLSGASRVIVAEPLRHKRDLAGQLGADALLDPLSQNLRDAVLDLTAVGADVVIECVGKAETAALAVDLARRGGTVELFGVCPVGVTVPLEPNKVYARELTIVGSYVNPYAFARSIALLESGRVRVDKFPIDRFPLDGVHEALTLQKEGRTIKSIIRPNA